MRKLIGLLFVSALAVSGITMSSCTKEDKCKDISCQNGGTCSDGKCNCPSGTKGDRCETIIAKKMTVKDITLTDFPALKPDGKTTWDTPLTDEYGNPPGNNPDIQIRVLVDGQAMSGMSFLIRPDVTKGNLPQNFGDYNKQNLVFTDMNATITIDIKDHDEVGGVTSPESMGSIEFKLADYIESRPATITLKSKDGNYSVVFKPVWE